MPTVTPWEPTLLDLKSNPGSPWVLVRGKCGHDEYFRERRCIKRFSSARNATAFINAKKLNETLDIENGADIIETIEA